MATTKTAKDIPKQFVNWVKKHFVGELDTIDFVGEYDFKLSVGENITLFQQKFPTMFKPTDAELTAGIKAQMEKEELLKIQELKKEENETIEQFKAQKPSNIQIEGFETAKHLILMTAKGLNNATILFGEGGCGKTCLTINTIKETLPPTEWNYRNGYTTALSMVKTLYNNQDKLIILDDIEGALTDNKAISILKSALWDSDGKRLIYYESTSKAAQEVPSPFEFRGRLIILCNKIPRGDDVNVQALLSRAITYELKFTYNQKFKIISQIVADNPTLTPQQKERIMEILQKNTNLATLNFNFRTLQKLIAMVKYDINKAEQLFRETTQEDLIKALVWKVINESEVAGNRTAQVQRFIEYCIRLGLNGSRATFFRRLREIKEEMKRDLRAKEEISIKVSQNEGVR